MALPSSEWVFNVQEKEFESKVIDKSKEAPVVVDFWSAGCAPCRMLGPMLEAAVKARNGEVFLAKVNIDENPQLAMAFRIEAVPTVLAFRNGQLVNEFTGLLPESYLDEFFNQIQPSEAEKMVRQAAGLESTDAAQAEQFYRQVLAKDDRLDIAQVGLARVLIAQKKMAEAAELLENIVATGELDAEVERLKGSLALQGKSSEFGAEEALRQRLETEPDNAELCYELGCVLANGGKYQEALEMLLSAGQRNPKLATSKVRESMVNIFHVVGDHSELANEYRQKLALLLY